ncbi:MAG: Ig-like domain-containing protein [Fimbriimonadales bacterium]|nr:Ig-like domain-containing protein [Fimbriimonadales bacterium]
MIAKLAALWLAVAAVAPKPVQLSLNIADGDVIDKARTIRVRVTAEDPVTQVEFFVGEDLRDTDSSTPYEFRIDPLDEQEGDLTLTFAAYTTEGDSARKSVRVRIDSGASKGADFHVRAAEDSLQESKWDDAIHSARVALKADANSVPAKLAMAKAYFGKGVLDSAQRYAEDVLAADPNNAQARQLVAAVNLRRAFGVSASADRLQNLESIGSALKAAVNARKAILESQLEALGQPTEANLLRFADTAILLGRFRMAANALRPPFEKDDRRSDVANRYAYALMRDGRFQEALMVLDVHARTKQMDAYGHALAAMLLSFLSEPSKSEEALKEAVLADSQNLGVRLAQAYLALRKRDLPVLRSLVTDLAREVDASPFVDYYLASLYDFAKDYDAANRAFERAVLAEPMLFDVYVDKGIQALRASQREKEKADADFQFARARTYFEVALEAKPESPEALTGISLMHLLKRQIRDAVRFAEAAVKAGADYAPGHYALAAALADYEAELRTLGTRQQAEGKRQESEATMALAREVNQRAFRSKEEAGKRDRQQLGGLAAVPKAKEAFDYFERYGKMPVVPAP